MKKLTPLFIVCLLATCSFAQTNTVGSYLNKADSLILKKDYEAAFDLLANAIREMPDSSVIYDYRGNLFIAFGLFDEAILDFTDAIEVCKDSIMKSHLLSNRGGGKHKIRDFTGCYDDLIQALKYDSTNIDALNNLATVCDDVGKGDEAIGYLNQVIKVDSTYVPAYVNLGFIHQQSEDHQKAIEFFNTAIDLAPDEALGYSNRSYSRLKTKNLRGAMKDINRSLKLYPANSYAYKIRALILIEKKKIEEACEDLENAEELGYTRQYGSEVSELQDQYCH